MSWTKNKEAELKNPHVDCKMNYNEWRRMLSFPSFRLSIGFPDSILIECFKVEDKEIIKEIWNFHTRKCNNETFMDKNPYAIPMYGQLSYTNHQDFMNCINVDFHKEHNKFKEFCRYYLKFGDVDENWGGGLFKR